MYKANMFKSQRYWATFLLCLYFGLVVHVASFTIPEEIEENDSTQSRFPYPPGSEEFKRWLEVQGERTVQKIMDKIVSPNDTSMQYEAKVAVARYLVNVTFTAMTRRLNLGKSVAIPETASLPETTTEMSNVTEILDMMEGETLLNETDVSTTTQLYEEILVVLGGGNVTSPEEAIPASAPFVPENGTETTTAASRPIWQEILAFNFSSALSGEGGGGLLNLSRLTNREGGGSFFNLSRLTGGSGGGAGLFNITRLTSGAEGGNSLFNITRLTGGGEGGNSLFNITRLTGGGEGGNGLFNITRLTGGGAGGSGLFNLSRLTGGEGGAGGLFNLSRLTGGEGGNSLFNLSRLSAGGGGLAALFNRSAGMEISGPMILSMLNVTSGLENSSLAFILPPEGFLVYPTPPPMNDSVRMSQMKLMTQVDKLVGDINMNNLTGIVDSTINIATPSTVGVLVNSLLQIVLCNPVDRWNGNCGVE